MGPFMLALALAKSPTAAKAPPLGCVPTCKDQALCQTLTQIFRRKPLKDAQISFVAQALDSDTPLASCNPSQPLNPASNAKLWTTAAALTKLGTAHRYPTRIYYHLSKVKDGVLHGDLYIRTDLDPSLVTGQIFEMAQTLYARGLRAIKGKITFDLEPKRRSALPPAFDQKEELVSYRTAIGAPSINYNTFVVWVTPGPKKGAPASIAVVPPIQDLSIDNNSSTTRGSSNRARVNLVKGKGKTFRVQVDGNVGIRASERSTRLPRYDPTQYTAEVFTQSLNAAQIKTSSSDYRIAKVPDSASLVLRHDSRPLGALIGSVNKFSNNFMAEQILWSLGSPTSSPKDALQELKGFAQKIGTPMKGLRFGNASGLYDSNRMSADQIVHLLKYAARNFQIAPDYLSSLAVMGKDGTTRRRLHNSPASGWVRVKTGTLDGVSALSGYISAPGKSPIVFSILINGFKNWEIGRARQRQDDVVLALYDLLADPVDKPAQRR